jgi:prepilin peptidase CpaA
MHSTFPLVLWLAAFAAMFSAAVTDLKTRRIPNGLVLVVLALAMSLQLLSERGTLWLSLIVAGAIFVVGAALTSIGIVGGGDTKMISAASVLFPPALVPGLLVCIALAGGILSLFYLGASWLARRGMGAALADGEPLPGASEFDHLVRVEVARMRAHEPMPYGVAIFGGTLSLIMIGVLSCISETSCSLLA